MHLSILFIGVEVLAEVVEHTNEHLEFVALNFGLRKLQKYHLNYLKILQ